MSDSKHVTYEDAGVDTAEGGRAVDAYGRGVADVHHISVGRCGQEQSCDHAESGARSDELTHHNHPPAGMRVHFQGTPDGTCCEGVVDQAGEVR